MMKDMQEVLEVLSCKPTFYQANLMLGLKSRFDLVLTLARLHRYLEYIVVRGMYG